MTNKFSIILPVRNGINYVKECVTSILEQTFQDFNLIILDNNSSDGTYEWLQSLNSEKIIIHRTTKDLDINANWRRANFINTNEFVTFIGHDDRYHSNYLSSINELISEFPDASIYQTQFHYIDSAGKFVRECKPMQEKILVQDFLKGQFTNTLDSMGTGYVFRYKDFKKLDGFSDNYPNLIFSDYQIFVELTGISYLAVSPLYTFDYRLHKSLSITTDAEKNYRVERIMFQFSFCIS
ncbi:MAG: glycosyltransferase family 2 protein [Arachidicoccus sp.]|nr:glycosyltransferase family 2 protein [Arachidicoccus sp.]